MILLLLLRLALLTFDELVWSSTLTGRRFKEKSRYNKREILDMPNVVIGEMMSVSFLLWLQRNKSKSLLGEQEIASLIEFPLRDRELKTKETQKSKWKYFMSTSYTSLVGGCMDEKSLFLIIILEMR